jgi:SAM-dependent methyltransferase
LLLSFVCIQEALVSQPLNISDHYGVKDLTAQVCQALRAAGLDRGTIDWRDLAPLDQFHVRGLAATRELAAGLGLEADMTILDIGCGLGGPARYLAATFGCRVTGIDQSRSFIDVARLLAGRAGLSDRVNYQQGDALALPFMDATFDHAWTQHVAMNISNRTSFYRNIHRVLKPGGRLAIYDVVAGNGDPLIFPVPWARAPEISFLLTSGAMRDMLGKTGFREVSWADTTKTGIAWFAEQQVVRRSAAITHPLGVEVVMGPEFAGMAANLGRNLQEGRACLVEAIVERL